MLTNFIFCQVIFVQITEFILYCECLISNNDWDRALAFAPFVSYQYWEDVSNKYADFLKTKNSENTTPY